jgi:hypothetical protein
MWPSVQACCSSGRDDVGMPVGLLLEDLLRLFGEDDGRLPDCLVEDSTPADWQPILDLVRDRGWPAVWACDSGDRPAPADAADLLAQVAVLRVWPVQDLQVNLFPGGEVRFDFDRRELRDQAAADGLCNFIRSAGQALRKDVRMCPEGGRDIAIVRYAAATDTFHAVSDHTPKP